MKELDKYRYAEKCLYEYKRNLAGLKVLPADIWIQRDSVGPRASANCAYREGRGADQVAREGNTTDRAADRGYDGARSARVLTEQGTNGDIEASVLWAEPRRRSNGRAEDSQAHLL